MAHRDGAVDHKKLGQMVALDMVHTIVETGHKHLPQRQEDEPLSLEGVAYSTQQEVYLQGWQSIWHIFLFFCSYLKE